MAESEKNTIGGYQDRTVGRWQDWFNLVLAVWLFIAPYVAFEARDDMAAWNAYICGVVVAIFAIAALRRPQVWEEWLNLVVGVWLIVAPFALGFSDQPAATWNQIIVGLLIGGDALWAALQYSPRRVGHA